jgi:hypothetical protein
MRAGPSCALGRLLLALAAAACVRHSTAQAKTPVVVGYLGHQYRTLDGEWPNSTTLGCQAFSGLPMPPGYGWVIADADQSSARADVQQVALSYTWGSHCLVVEVADTLESINTAWPRLETEDRETCESLRGGRVSTETRNGIIVYKLPGNCRLSRQRLLIKRQCAPGCYHGPNMTTYPTTVDPYCTRCAHGTFSTWGSSACTRCVAGQYAQRVENAHDASGMCGATECDLCDTVPGYYCPPASISIKGEACPAGYYCSGGASDRLSCATGQFSDTIGAIDISTCRPCTAPQGNYCPPASTSAAGSTCPPGHFCTGGVTDKQACAAGTYSPQTGASAISTCQNCLPGKYLQTTGNDAASDCQDCSAGTFSMAGASRCQDCSAPPGNYCPPASGSPNGTHCPVAHYCVGGARDKTPCPANTYGPEIGAKNEISGCIRCASGFALVGSSSCFICPIGKFSDPGSADPCPDCEPGFYSPVPGVLACLTCVAGTYSESKGASVCMDCPGGTFSGVSGTCREGPGCGATALQLAVVACCLLARSRPTACAC